MHGLRDWTRFVVALAVVTATISSCGSGDNDGDQAKWCELTVENTAAPAALDDAELDRWMAAAPPDIRDETEAFVTVAKELREMIGDEPEGDQQTVANQALAGLLAVPEVQRAGATMQQYMFNNCPGFEP